MRLEEEEEESEKREMKNMANREVKSGRERERT